MPMSRYEIRNEYSLADPELYRAADKDDPEALLEGVAMAGLVGVLRQLGDLAQFAAEIFHDLHEEVMATAARGHSLTIRVQQLEAEVPSIEKAFLSQTDHSSFFYNAGVDWRPNLRMDQNLVTQGDLPRLIMDSYEECRGPPRLFLLDKFDTAGAGACLKRYTDPSVFKVETSAMANADIQREKKIRKIKRKGLREVLPASHAKLHQLLAEEPIENGVSKPTHRAKLKRRPNGFPFDSKTRKSCMEKLLKTSSPEHKMLHEITETLPLRLSENHHNECDLDVLEPRSVSPARGSEGRKINPPSPEREDIMLSPFMNQTNDESTDIKMCEGTSYLDTVTNGITSTFDEEDVEKDITVYGESKMEGSLIGYQSDEVASEIDNYMDASSTMESEMDRDSELRAKNDFTSSYIKSKLLVSVENEEHLLSQLSDSQSTEELTISDEGNNFCRKEMSSFLSSDYPRTSAESPQSEKLSAEGLPSADIPEIATGNASSYHKTADEDFPVDGLPEPVVSNNTFPGKDALPNNQSDFEQLTSDLCHTNSIPVLPYYDSRRVVGKARLMRPKSDETASTSDDEEKKTNLIVDSPCSGSVSHSKSLSRDDSPGSSSEEHLVDSENVPCMSAVADIICPTSDSSAAIPAYLLHEDDFDREDLNQFGNMTSTLNIDNVLFQKRIDAEEVISSENPILGKLVNEVTKLPDNFASDSTDIAHNGDNITSKASEGEKQNDNLYKEGLNVVPDDPNPFSCVMDASIGKEFREEIISNENSTPGKLDNKVTELPDNFAFDSADRDQNGGNITSYVSEGERQNGHLYNEDTNVVSDAPNHVSCLIDSSTGKEFRETSLSNAETVNSEDHHFNSSTGNQISSETLILSGMENSPDLLGEDLDAYDTDFIPEEATTVNKIPELGTPKSCEVVGLWGTGLTDDVTPIDLVALKSSFSPENLEDPAGTSDTAEKDGINPDSGVIGLELTEIPSPADLKLVKEVHVLLGESDSKTDQSETAVMACSVPAVSDNTIWENVSLPAGLDKLVEEHVPCFENSGLGELENDKTSFSVGNRELELVDEDKNHLSGSYRELDLVEKVDKIEAATLDFHKNVCCSDNNDHRKSEVLQNVFNSCHDSGVEHSVDFINTAQIHSPLEQSGFDTDQESFQKSGIENQVYDSNALPIDRVTEEKTLQEKIELAHEQIDKESPDSSEISSELSSLLPITHQQMLDHDNDKGHNNFASSFPLVNFPSSVSGLSGLRNCGTDVCAYPKEQLGFIFPPSNLFSEANQINLNESPPLPPLPPLKWRMEKFHHALSSTEVDKMEQKEVLPREIFPAPSAGNVSSSLEQMDPSPVKNASLLSLKEENVEHSFPRLQANSMHETIDLSPEVENEQQQLVMPTQDSESSPGLEANSMHQTIDLPSKIENEQQQQLVMPTQESKNFPSLKANSLHETIDLATKIENEQQQLVMPTQESESSPSLEANSVHETADLPPKIENEQGQLVFPTQESEVKSPDEEDGVANGSRTAKLHQSCNPLIGSVAALDESKSKLRKVTEQVRPQIQKLDERDSLLEQIRAKSVNLKPPVVSRPSTQCPNTNLKVAAILEKANAIRQALAGSDEDDEDNWSDS